MKNVRENEAFLLIHASSFWLPSLWLWQMVFTPPFHRLACLHYEETDENSTSVLMHKSNEPHREKTGFLPRRKQRRRSASR